MKQVYILYGTFASSYCDRIIAVYSSYEAAQADFQAWMAANELNPNPEITDIYIKQQEYEGMYILPYTVHDNPMGVKK